MATVKCALGRRGQASHEWNDGTKDRIYCHGWVDKKTDEFLPECKACPDHVNKAQEDLEAWNAAIPPERRLTTMEWISVEKRLPEKSKKVLAYWNNSGGGIICLAYFFGDEGWACIGWETRPDAVTHWMPLPSPPEILMGYEVVEETQVPV